jgi:hypothetical protein
MTWKRVMSIVLVFLFVAMLILYWYFPSDPREFNFELYPSTNFSDNDTNVGMQFYPDMRFPSKEISYDINEACTLKKKAEMIEAFNILENLTSLKFYPSSNAEIEIMCEDKVVVDNGMFIAGEGGPANVSLGNLYSVIQNGHILLIRESKCERPNIAIHEALHVLGFDHSDNVNNIMYPVSKCRQEISDDLIGEINRLYSVPSLPDIALEKVSAEMKNRFLNANITLQNQGLRESGNFSIEIYADDKLIEEVEVSNTPLGAGKEISVTNILISQIKVDKLVFSVKGLGQELNEKNNIATLEI